MSYNSINGNCKQQQKKSYVNLKAVENILPPFGATWVFSLVPVFCMRLHRIKAEIALN